METNPASISMIEDKHLPACHENVLIKTKHFRRMAYLDSSGVWRWTENRESVAEQVLDWKLPALQPN